MAMGSKTPNSSSVDRYPTGDERSQDYLESRLNIELNLMGTSWDHGDQRGLETRLIAVSIIHFFSKTFFNCQVQKAKSLTV